MTKVLSRPMPLLRKIWSKASPSLRRSLRPSLWPGELLARFAADRQGVVAIFFVLALVPIMAAGGAAIDLSRAYIVKQRLGIALDAAGLAVGSSNGLSDEDLNQLMVDYFNANYPAAEIGVTATPTLTIDGGEITLTATADVATTLMRIAQVDKITVPRPPRLFAKPPAWTWSWYWTTPVPCPDQKLSR